MQVNGGVGPVPPLVGPPTVRELIVPLENAEGRGQSLCVLDHAHFPLRRFGPTQQPYKLLPQSHDERQHVLLVRVGGVLFGQERVALQKARGVWVVVQQLVDQMDQPAILLVAAQRSEPHLPVESRLVRLGDCRPGVLPPRLISKLILQPLPPLWIVSFDGELWPPAHTRHPAEQTVARSQLERSSASVQPGGEELWWVEEVEGGFAQVAAPSLRAVDRRDLHLQPLVEGHHAVQEECDCSRAHEQGPRDGPNRRPSANAPLS
mmetsp:Transcript_46586/g.116017  ORF Transcript_46586/g.116017 Transcript_46586/m.116017 type:complete len:263 (+) Transcript_46586:359-1147(+)